EAARAVNVHQLMDRHEHLLGRVACLPPHSGTVGIAQICAGRQGVEPVDDVERVQACCLELQCCLGELDLNAHGITLPAKDGVLLCFVVSLLDDEVECCAPTAEQRRQQHRHCNRYERDVETSFVRWCGPGVIGHRGQ